MGLHPGEYSGLDHLRAHIMFDLDRLKDSGSNDWGSLHLFYVAQDGNYYGEDCTYRRIRIVASEKAASYLGLPKVAGDPDSQPVDLYHKLSVAGLSNSITERQPDLVWTKLAELFGLHWETHKPVYPGPTPQGSPPQAIASFLAVLMGRPCIGFLTGDSADSTTEEEDKAIFVEAGDDEEEDKDDYGEDPESLRRNVITHAAQVSAIEVWPETD